MAMRRGVAKRGIERERKFLVKAIPPGIERGDHELIEQGYLTVGSRNDRGIEIRVRRTPSGSVLTVKRGEGAARHETEVPLAAASAGALWPLTKGRRVRKMRYTIRQGKGPQIQVDVYRGRLRGLAVAEVEFPTMTQLRRFRPPAWFGKEITGVAAYSNSRLAGADGAAGP